jgi:IclR family acetate operon transcriptional repressor
MTVTNHSVDRALSVLRLVAAAGRPLRFTELVDLTGIPKATLHGLLGSLEKARFLSRTQTGYQVGIAAFEVGTAMPVASSLRDAVAPVLDSLSAETKESCHLGVLVGTDVVYLDRRDTGEGLRFASRVGQRLPAHATALGKAMLASLDDVELAKRYPARLSRVTPRTIATRADLLEILAEVRSRGYAVESEESTPGIRCIGMPVVAPDAILGVSVTVPVQRASEAQLLDFLPVLTVASTRIQEITGARHWLGLEGDAPITGEAAR